MLAVLAGAVLADLAVGDGGVAFGGALAAMVDRLTDETATLAGKRLGTPPLELADTGGRQVHWTGCNASTIEKVPAVATHLAASQGWGVVREHVGK